MSGRPYVKTVIAETEDPLAGTWVFNDTIDYTSFVSVTGATAIEFNFTSNGNTYFGITTDFKPNGLKYIITPDTSDLEFVYAASTNTWTNEAYKIITITSKLSEVTIYGDGLLAWLQETATKQSAANGGRLYVKTQLKGNFLVTSDGITLQDCNGNYLEFTGAEDTPATNGGRLYTKVWIKEPLAAAQNLSIDGTTLTFDEVDGATSYDVYANETFIGEVEV